MSVDVDVVTHMVGSVLHLWAIPIQRSTEFFLFSLVVLAMVATMVIVIVICLFIVS
jgi:hypothetical protein